MNCPKCAQPIRDPDALECPSCGVVLRKAVADHAWQPAVPPRQAAPARGPSTGSPRLLLTVIVIVAAIAYGVTRRHHEEGAAPAEGWYLGSTGYERALSEQRAGQPLFLVFDTDWCGWCKKLDADVFKSAEFNQRYGSMLKVKVNAESTAANVRLAEQFGVRGYPAAFVLKKGREPQPISGYSPLPDYLARIDALTR